MAPTTRKLSRLNGLPLPQQGQRPDDRREQQDGRHLESQHEVAKQKGGKLGNRVRIHVGDSLDGLVVEIAGSVY